MKKNVGGADRMMRMIVGVVLIALAILVPTVWGWIGVVPLVTGLFSFCPVYLPFGWNTCPPPSESAGG
jgi:membrane-bound ClpP family serine protease